MRRLLGKRAASDDERRWWSQWRQSKEKQPRTNLQEVKDTHQRKGSFERCDTMLSLRLSEKEPAAPALCVSSSESDSDSIGSPSKTKKKRLFKKEPIDVDAYMAEREMSPMQERANALTMIPNPVFCIYFLLAGLWVDETFVQDASNTPRADLGTPFNALLADSKGCIHSSWFPKLYALPPLPIIMIAAGICLHAPFSFLYHWKYATTLPSGRPRTEHWSRRMDHCMIHAASACLSYGTSGSWDFFVVNLIFNLDCMVRQFQQKVRPRSNVIRIVISVLAYSIPILKRGQLEVFGLLMVLFGISLFFFSKYPIGGWSHSVFHLIMSFVPPLLMMAACDLPASQAQMKLAAECAAMH